MGFIKLAKPNGVFTELGITGNHSEHPIIQIFNCRAWSHSAKWLVDRMLLDSWRNETYPCCHYVLTGFTVYHVSHSVCPTSRFWSSCTFSPYPFCAKWKRRASDIYSLSELLSVEVEAVRPTTKNRQSALQYKGLSVRFVKISGWGGARGGLQLWHDQYETTIKGWGLNIWTYLKLLCIILYVFPHRDYKYLTKNKWFFKTKSGVWF
jgi:hypothetical protein